MLLGYALVLINFGIKGDITTEENAGVILVVGVFLEVCGNAFYGCERQQNPCHCRWEDWQVLEGLEVDFWASGLSSKLFMVFEEQCGLVDSYNDTLWLCDLI